MLLHNLINSPRHAVFTVADSRGAPWGFLVVCIDTMHNAATFKTGLVPISEGSGIDIRRRAASDFDAEGLASFPD